MSFFDIFEDEDEESINEAEPDFIKNHLIKRSLDYYFNFLNEKSLDDSGNESSI